MDDLQVRTTPSDSARNGQLMLRITRVLRPADGAAPAGDAGKPCLSGTSQRPDGPTARGVLATTWYREGASGRALMRIEARQVVPV